MQVQASKMASTRANKEGANPREPERDHTLPKKERKLIISSQDVQLQIKDKKTKEEAEQQDKKEKQERLKR